MPNYSSKLRQAINKYNSAVRNYNSAVRRQRDNYNRAVGQHNSRVRQYNQARRRAIDEYNQWVRAYNARAHANRQRLRSELSRLRLQSSSSRYVSLRTSVDSLTSSYGRLDQWTGSGSASPGINFVADLAERETANSVAVLNALIDSTAAPQQEEGEELDDGRLGDALRMVSPDLDARWRGAVYALNPNNPDAARHFCTSAREVFTHILDLKAPDVEVELMDPPCQRTERGTPTRRSKIRFLLQRKGMLHSEIEDFVEQDMDNVVQLFDVLNTGTHGPAGALDVVQLRAVKKRVEDGITFLTRLVV